MIQNLTSLPNPEDWLKQYGELRDSKVDGYYYGSPISASPIGAYEIFEGQARFIQLQYIYFASGGQLSWHDIESGGMLQGVYGEAFRAFMSLTEFNRPETFDDPIIALFLLICDMASNPSAALPMPLTSPRTFIEDTDPGIRFVFLCHAASINRTAVAKAIKSYSRSEYKEVSELLAHAIQIDPPLRVCEEIARWTQNSLSVNDLMKEHRTFKLRSDNLPVRMLASLFIAFNSNKSLRPEVFCWPGAWMAGERCSREFELLFNSHRALFVDKADDDGIFPSLHPDKLEDDVMHAFHAFYSGNIVYDMTSQWIDVYGPFRYNYNWLSSNGTLEQIKSFADNAFNVAYSVLPDNFRILNDSWRVNV